MTLSNQTMLNRKSCTAQSTTQFNSKTDEEESPNNVKWRETTNWIWPFFHKRQRSTTLTTIVLPLLLLLPSLTMTARNVITKYLSIHCRGDVRVCAQNRCIRGRCRKATRNTRASDYRSPDDDCVAFVFSFTKWKIQHFFFSFRKCWKLVFFSLILCMAHSTSFFLCLFSRSLIHVCRTFVRFVDAAVILAKLKSRL